MESILNSSDDRTRDDLIKELCDTAATKYGKVDTRRFRSDTVVVLQAPNLTWSHTAISERLPNARVVYMLRDVRAVVASMHQLPKIPFVKNQIRFFRQTGFIAGEFPQQWERLMDRNVSQAVKMAFVARIEMSLAGKFESAGITVLQVRYEDLVSAPKETVSRVTRHLGIPFDEQCLRHDEILIGHGPGGTDRRRPIDVRSISKWHEQLKPETIESIWAAVGEFYEELGYRLDSLLPTSHGSPPSR